MAVEHTSLQLPPASLMTIIHILEWCGGGRSSVTRIKWTLTNEEAAAGGETPATGWQRKWKTKRRCKRRKTGSDAEYLTERDSRLGLRPLGGKRQARIGKTKWSVGSVEKGHCGRCVMGGVTTETQAEIRTSRTVGVIICESELERGPLWCLIRWGGGNNTCTAGDQFAFSAV